jgi:4-alpha-glucanotransferase
VRTGRRARLGAAERCPLPGERAWGWAVQLYAARSSGSWGIGDLADLRELGRWSRSLGAGFLLLNPLHAGASHPTHQPSPYFPSSRRFRDPIYLAIEELPGAAALDGEVGELHALARAGRALNGRRLIDRDVVAELKRRALERLWESWQRTGGDARFERYRDEQGEPLREWAIYRTIEEQQRAGWRSWPEPLRERQRTVLARAAAQHQDLVAFHEWLQWLLDEQLADAAGQIRIVNDLAIGFDPDGFDAWSWQELLAPGVTIGAPPDAFNRLGQDWNLPAFDPDRLADAGFRPFVETLRASVRHAAGLRIDHVMGLFRLWWVPHRKGAAADPKDGQYVAYPADALLDCVVSEAQRSGAFVIGEDLGTVEPRVRRELASRDILSYRLMLFERSAPEAYPEHSLAAVSTHDLPTIAGLWTDADLAQQRAAGLQPNTESHAQLRAALAQVAPGDSLDEVILGAYRRLAESPALLVAATLEDALRVTERPNLPGTTQEQAPNWSLTLPRPLEQIAADPFVRRLADALSR